MLFCSSTLVGGPNERFHPEHVLVRFKPGTVASEMGAAHAAAGRSRILHRYGSVDRLMLVEVPAGRVRHAVASYKRNPNVLYAEPDYQVRATAIPNDVAFPLQWGLHNTGQLSDGVPGSVGSDIDAVAAWDIATGSSSIQVAVIDTGVDYTHPDLVDNMYVNPLELPGNGVDDDRNGWVDDVFGFDFINNDGDPMDDQSHGTHVAGIIGARADNGIGVAGVAWRCKIVALKFLGPDGTGDVSGAVKAIDYIIAHRIPISNNSWGGEDASQAMYDAISAAHSIGHLFFAAAGNEALNTDQTGHYPSGYNLPNIISVAATDNWDEPASFSNLGPTTVDLGAPGVGIYSTLPLDSYGFKGGTSMATPYVAGAAAVIMAYAPGLSSLEVRARILDSVRPVPYLDGWTVTGGVLDLAAALGDCNGNGVTDDVDIATGTSDDCSENGIPDECESDCNLNGNADSCDIASGAADDCDANGVPDVCDPDCDQNDLVDACEILGGQAFDCNANEIIDRCEPDFDGDGVIDGCDDDTDDDGVLNNADVCDFTPVGAPIRADGAPMGDADQDCALTNADYFILFDCYYFGGPDEPISDRMCRTNFDFDRTDALDLRDFAVFQVSFSYP